MTDPVKALVKSLRARCRPSVDLVLGEYRSEDWRSMLFDGGCHHFTLLLHGDDINGALADIDRAMAASDLCLPGHLIVDIEREAAIREADRWTVTVKARTIEDRFAVSV